MTGGGRARAIVCERLSRNPKNRSWAPTFDVPRPDGCPATLPTLRDATDLRLHRDYPAAFVNPAVTWPVPPLETASPNLIAAGRADTLTEPTVVQLVPVVP